MATDIRESIFVNIQETLQGILERDGYNYTIDPDNVLIIRGKRDDSAYAEPIIFIYPGEERTILEKGEKGRDYNELDVQIEAFIRGEKDTMNTNINKIIADLKKSLGTDHTRGGYAIDTFFTSNNVFITDLTGDKCGVILNIEIHYMHNYADPFN